MRIGAATAWKIAVVANDARGIFGRLFLSLSARCTALGVAFTKVCRYGYEWTHSNERELKSCQWW